MKDLTLRPDGRYYKSGSNGGHPISAAAAIEELYRPFYNRAAEHLYPERWEAYVAAHNCHIGKWSGPLWTSPEVGGTAEEVQAIKTYAKTNFVPVGVGGNSEVRYDPSKWTEKRRNKSQTRRPHKGFTTRDIEGKLFDALKEEHAPAGEVVLTRTNGQDSDAHILDNWNRIFWFFEIKADAGKNSVGHAEGQLRQQEWEASQWREVLHEGWTVRKVLVVPKAPSKKWSRWLSSSDVNVGVKVLKIK